MKTHKIDILNVGLVILSFFLAITLPVRLFLFSYIILGPLHYLTEIGWLEKRNYFAKKKNDVWILAFLTAILTAGYYLANSGLTTNSEQAPWLNLIIEINEYAGAGIIFFAFGAAFAMVTMKESSIRYLTIFLVAILSLFVHFIQPIYLIFGVFVPTIIHVSLFTALFMLYGSLKNKSVWGFVAVAIFITGCFSIFFIDKPPRSIGASQDSLQMLLDSSFINIGATFSYFIGLREFGADYMLLTKLGIQIQTLFAFCYTYHYLNWFSKTKIINWHEVSRTWLVLTGVLWAAALIVYFIDYKIGFLTLFFLSMLHVILEFPLNHLSAIGIFQEIKGRISSSS